MTLKYLSTLTMPMITGFLLTTQSMIFQKSLREVEELLGDWIFQFSIDDRSLPQYVTGENIALMLTTENAKLGENVGSLNFDVTNSYFKSFFDSKNIYSRCWIRIYFKIFWPTIE